MRLAREAIAEKHRPTRIPMSYGQTRRNTNHDVRRRRWWHRSQSGELLRSETTDTPSLS